MKKSYFWGLLLAVMALVPSQNAFADYCTYSGYKNNDARNLSAFTLTDGVTEFTVSSIQTSYSAVYQDKTASVFETTPGATISFSSITWPGEWMHGYVFIDYNNDGEFDATLNADGTTGGELVSYNFYSEGGASTGYNSKGETVQNNCGVKATNMPSWTLPSGLSGEVRMRFNIAWNSINPCGYAEMKDNSGCMCDITLQIGEPTTTRTISVSVNPAEAGTVTINGEEVSEVTAEGGITLVATPAEGYQFVNWTLNGEVVSTNATYVDGTEGDKAYVANFVALEVYTVSVSVNDATMGTATSTAEGSVYEGTQITLEATSAEGYVFVNWTVDGTEVSTDATFVTTADASAEYVANFRALEVYTVAVSVNDTAMGTATSTVEGQVYEGTEITLMATAAEGYVFVNWTVDGAEVSTNTSFTTTVNASAEYVANFELVPSKLNLVGITASFADDGYTKLSAIIDGNYSTEFYKQTGSGAYITVELEQESLVGDIVMVFYNYASYQPKQAKIQVSTDNVTYEDVEGCSFVRSDIKSGLLTLKAKGVPAKYVRLLFEDTEWVDLYEFEVYEATVNVAPRQISVSVNDETMGIAYIGTEEIKEVVDNTTTVKVTAVANEGYEFVNWTLNGEVVSTNATYIDKTEGDKVYVANFKASAVYNVTVSVNNELMGTATATQTGEVFNNTSITLTATPNEGYEFLGWTVGETVVSKESSYTVNVVEDVDYVANFRMKLTKINLVSAASNGFSYAYNASRLIDGTYTTYFSGYQAAGSSIVVEMEEEMPVGEVKLFIWAEYGEIGTTKILVSTDNSTWTEVEGAEFDNSDLEYDSALEVHTIAIDGKATLAKYVKVYFATTGDSYIYFNEIEVYEATVNVAPRTISASVNDATMGTAYVGAEGTTELTEQTGKVKVSATPASNAYRFVNWTLNGEVVETSATFFDRTEGDKAYVANFEAKPIYTVSVASATAKRGSATCDAAEVVYEGDVVTFTATPADGYGFINWTVNGEEVSTANPYVLEITESIDLVANFDVNPELDRSAWSVYTVSSEYAGLDGDQYVTGDKAIDGSTSTYWHTDWDNAANKKVPQWIVFDLGAVKLFDSFNYVSRSESQTANGNIGGYQLYVSDEAPSLEDLTGTMTMVTEGTFTYPGQEHQVELGKVAKGRYVMLYATSTYGEGGADQFANCAEFYLYLKAYSVTVSSSNPAQGTAYIGEEGITSADCSVEGTDVVTITAVPAEGYQFVNWTLEGEVVSTEAEYTTPAVTEGRDYVANFEFAPVAPRTITAAVNNAAKGSVVFLAPASTETSVVSDSIVVMEAVPATTDDFFVNWTINGAEVSTETTYEYLGAADVTIQANFESRYVVSIAQVSGGTISVKANATSISTGDRVLEGSNLTISVVENSRSELKKLFVNGTDVFVQYKYNPNFSVAVTGTTVITAEFGDPVCIVTWENIGNGYVEAWEYDTYDEEADTEGTLEIPVSPDGAQYAWGDEVPFLSTLAIFAYPMGDDVLESVTINGEELNLEDDFYYGDYFIPEVEGKLHIVATFTGEGSGIEDADAEAANVYAVAGGIKVVTAEAANVSIYSIAGVLVAEQTISETTTIAMEQGVYIVKVADKVSKVIVK